MSFLRIVTDGFAKLHGVTQADLDELEKRDRAEAASPTSPGDASQKGDRDAAGE